MRHSLAILVNLVAIPVVTVLAAAATNHFQQWYPEYGFILDRIVHSNCSNQYELYTHGALDRNEWKNTSRWLGAGASAAHVVPLVECILEHAPEFVKSGMAGASVLLGLTPSILAAFGSDAAERSVLSVIGNRPFLALCLSVGSPAVPPLRLFEYRSFTEILGDRTGRLIPKFFGFYAESMILVAEYALVFAAIANNAALGYELGARATITFAPHLRYLVLLWSFLAAAPHIFAAIGLSRLVCIKPSSCQKTLHSQLATWFVPWKGRGTFHLLTYDEKPLYLSLSSFVSILTSVHFIFGTLVFSSLLFISIRDSLPIVGRYLASVFVCRVVLMFELARLRQLYNTGGYRLVKHGEIELDESLVGQ
ncbi:hypothetical protein MY8738_002470 [Beauveria namnaoensis]